MYVPGTWYRSSQQRWPWPLRAADGENATFFRHVFPPKSPQGERWFDPFPLSKSPKREKGNKWLDTFSFSSPKGKTCFDTCPSRAPKRKKMVWLNKFGKNKHHTRGKHPRQQKTWAHDQTPLRVHFIPGNMNMLTQTYWEWSTQLRVPLIAKTQ